jgi:hypothetical protein
MIDSGQRLHKHVTAETNAHKNRVNLGNEMFLRGQCRYVINKEQNQRVGSSAQEAVEIGPERVKLNNLHCYKPLLGNG